MSDLKISQQDEQNWIFYSVAFYRCIHKHYSNCTKKKRERFMRDLGDSEWRRELRGARPNSARELWVWVPLIFTQDAGVFPANFLFSGMNSSSPLHYLPVTTLRHCPLNFTSPIPHPREEPVTAVPLVLQGVKGK